MSVYRPKGSPYWHYDFVVKGRRFHGTTGTSDRELAKGIEAQQRADAVRQVHLGTKPEMTVDVAFGRYYSEIAESTTTANTVFYQLANLRRLIGADTLLSSLSDAVVSTFVARRRGERSARSGKGEPRMLSGASINRETQLLRRVAYWARDVLGVAVGDVAWKKQQLKEAKPRDRVLTAEEEARLLAEAADHLKAPIRLSLITGLRLGNVIGLDWRQIDFKARTIAFRTKGEGSLVLPITDEMLILLANLEPQDKGPVFTWKGEAIKTWKTAWRGAKRRAGVEDFRWHDMRHTAGSRMQRDTGDIYAVKETLGHADIKSTLRYVHHDGSSKRRALESQSRNSPKARKKRASK